MPFRILAGLTGGRRRATLARLPLPETLVEVVVTGGGPRGAARLEAVDQRTFTVSAIPELRPGHVALFSYQSERGRFRFSAHCVDRDGDVARFGLPSRIDVLASFVQGTAPHRASLRLDATVPVQWRAASGGKGHGEFARASITDISRSGASLIVDRAVRTGAQVEVKLPLTDDAPRVLLGEVLRVSTIAASGKVSLGLRFAAMRAEDDRAIMQFINKRQAQRRSRGLV